MAPAVDGAYSGLDTYISHSVGLRSIVEGDLIMQQQDRTETERRIAEELAKGPGWSMRLERAGMKLTAHEVNALVSATGINPRADEPNKFN